MAVVWSGRRYSKTVITLRMRHGQWIASLQLMANTVCLFQTFRPTIILCVVCCLNNILILEIGVHRFIQRKLSLCMKQMFSTRRTQSGVLNFISRAFKRELPHLANRTFQEEQNFLDRTQTRPSGSFGICIPLQIRRHTYRLALRSGQVVRSNR